ncbi:MAG: glycosyltransferase family 39 protein [Thermoplasmata archaeon]
MSKFGVKLKVIFFITFFILLLSFFVRYIRAPHGLPYLHYWDEPQIASTALNMMKTGDLNPHFFNYPGLIIYSCLFVDILHYYYLMGKDTSTYGSLNQLSEIKTKFDTGWHWYVSHPSFYLWNRILIIIFSTITVLIVFLIGKELYNLTVGAISALLLGLAPIYIQFSVLITTDAPLALFVTLALYFSLKYYLTGKHKFIYLSAVFAGCAISTKYNAFLSILIPLTSYLVTRNNPNWRDISFLLIIPLITFILLNPFSLLDLDTFLKDTGLEVRHYKVLGHPWAESNPGIDNFLFQLKSFSVNLTWPLLTLSLIGIGDLLLKGRLFFIIMSFPITYFFFMTQQKVNFHRNYLCLYPFICLLTAIGFNSLINAIFILLKRFKFKQKKYLSYAQFLPTMILIFFYIGPRYISEFRMSFQASRPETRTLAIQTINKFLEHRSSDNKIKIGLAKELHFHELDLAKLKCPYSLVSQKDLLSSADFFDFIIISKYKSFSKINEYICDELNLSTNEYIFNKKMSVISKYPYDNYAFIDVLSENPDIIIVNTKESKFGQPIPLGQFEIMEGKILERNDQVLSTYWNVNLKSPPIKLKEGKYALLLKAKGSKADNEFTRLRIYSDNMKFDKEYFYLNNQFDYYDTEFEIDKEREISFNISFDNDIRLNDKEDRNLWLKKIMIVKVHKETPLSQFKVKAGRVAEINDHIIRTFWNVILQSPLIGLKKGNYELLILARGSKAGNEFTRVKIYSRQVKFNKDYIYLDNEFNCYDVEFTLNDDKKISFNIEFDNDIRLNDDEDRNLWIKKVMLVKID